LRAGLLLFICLLFAGCNDTQQSMRKTDVIFELFKRKANQHGFRIDSVSGNDLLYLSRADENHIINLGNARKSYKLSGDTAKVDELVNLLLHLDDKLPTWTEAGSTLLPVLVPADMQELDNAVRKAVTDSTYAVLMRNLPDRVVWVQPEHAREWKQSEAALFQVAYANLGDMLKKAEVKPAALEGHAYGIITAEESYLESSMPLSPAFKAKVQKQFGWPVYAVIPVRDLCFIFSKKEFDFFSERFASAVLAEYNESPYPVTRELLKISDKGIETVGRYNSDGK
jgi:hypothetical protein